METAFLAHWPEYAIEGGLLGLFMVSACVCVVCVQHPASPLRGRIESGLGRRAVIGVAMGATAIALIYSAWGRRSGAHMNPGVTLAFYALGKVGGWDALFYVCAQFVGGCLGVGVSRLCLGRALEHESVRCVVTAPGPCGELAAWLAEFVIAFVLMSVVLLMANHGPTAGFAGIAAGILVALFITLEAPFSGMSMNPARTFASALVGGSYRGLWIYFTAPPLAMLSAAGMYTAAFGDVYCAKTAHDHSGSCIFRCRIEEMRGAEASPRSSSGIRVPPAR